ncbi:hypothetical protein HDV00_001239 [Rhizophlyctis rosea]|nr:hypothetical protein HDV00_001239 [Rhizophlyctis rosea]
MRGYGYSSSDQPNLACENENGESVGLAKLGGMASDQGLYAKQQLQSEDPTLRIQHKYKNSFHCAWTVFREEGLRGLYKGLSASLLGLTESTLQFVTYEYLKRHIADRRRVEEARSEMERTIISMVPKWVDTFAAAATAKLGAAILTYPHEVLRTRLRQTPENGVAKYTGLVQSAKLIYREEGLAALYGGMTAHLMRVVPNAAILFFCYELVISLFQKEEIHL